MHAPMSFGESALYSDEPQLFRSVALRLFDDAIGIMSEVMEVDVFDKSAIGDVEKALFESDLGMTPSNDGKVIRLNVPQLTEDRRKELGARCERAERTLQSTTGHAHLRRACADRGRSLRRRAFM